jgi:hypothetical protein
MALKLYASALGAGNGDDQVDEDPEKLLLDRDARSYVGSVRS